jgi:serine/threonine-protein kinase
MDGFPLQVSRHLCLPFPQRWRHLENLEKIGQGISGEVYRAWDPRLERAVALKLSPQAGNFSDHCAQLALGEARLLARIRHPNVVTVYGADYEDQRLGVWMEYVRGHNLEAILRKSGPLRARDAVVIGLDLCSAVNAVHDVGVVHGDITTKNVMREKTGRIVLLDFGFSQDLLAPQSEKWSHDIRGTPLYMAPEILQGDGATVQTDIYGIGVLLYHLATGRFPVEGRSLDEVRTILEEGNVQRLRDRRPDLGEAFVTGVDRSLSVEPAARFSTVVEMADWLRASLDSDVPSSRPAIGP